MINMPIHAPTRCEHILNAPVSRAPAPAPNLFYCGASAQPGNGVPLVMVSAKKAARLVRKALRVPPRLAPAHPRGSRVGIDLLVSQVFRPKSIAKPVYSDVMTLFAQKITQSTEM